MLLEREGVLGALADHLARADRGTGRLVFLHGEAGVGKTAVLDRFALTARTTAEVLTGWCDPLSTPRPLGPWLDVAPGLGGDIEREMARASSSPGGLSHVLRLLRTEFEARTSTVVVLEDLHWADEASLDLLCLLARRLSRCRVLVVASYRDDEIAPNRPLRVLFGHLAGVPGVYREAIELLSLPAVARLAAGGGLDVDQLYQVTGGNPFYVTEVLAAGGAGIPESVADAVAARLSRVSTAARDVAEAVAILGSPAPAPLVVRLSGQALTAADDLLSTGLLRASAGGLGFRHELARRAMLDTIPHARRTSLHAQVLELLRTDPVGGEDSAVLAHHAAAAGDVGAVLVHAPAAARTAAAVGAYREAAAHLRRAVAVCSGLPPEQRHSLVEQFGQVAAVANELTDAATALRSAAELRHAAGDRLREGDDLRWLSYVLWPLGRCAEAVEIGDAAVRALDDLPPSRELADAYVNMCRLGTLSQSGVANARPYAERTIALGRELEDPETVWEARFHLALTRFVCAEDGDPEAAWTEAEAARDGALHAGFVDAAAFMTMLMGMCSAWHRDHGRADAAYDLLERLSTDRDLLSFGAVNRAQHSYRLLQDGRWDEAAATAAAVLDHPGPPPVARVLPLAVLGLIRARRGDPEACEPLAEALAVPEPNMTLLARAFRAEAAWLEGDDERASAEALQGLDAATGHTDPWLTGELARWVALSGGDVPAVRAAGPVALELAGEWRSAAQRWEQRGCPYDAALARLSGDVPALLQARQTFAAFGAHAAERIAAARLRARGVRSGARGPRAATRGNPHGLTTRQLEILRLVAEGLTGPQIAARLYLSPKTVDHHVGAALTVLGVHSRADAVRAVFGGNDR
ncbi:ATP-binding protein [Pseudonocardia sichuanensis]